MTDPVITPEPVQEPVTPVETAPPAPVAEDYSALLQEIRNSEGSPKYGSAQEALASIPHKETHITKLETENETLRAQVLTLDAESQARASLLEELKTAQPIAAPTSEAPALDAKALDDAINQRLSHNERVTRINANVSDMEVQLLKQFGTPQAVTEALTKAASSYGMDAKGLLSLGASQSPKIVYDAVGMKREPIIGSPTPILEGKDLPLNPNEEKPLSGREAFARRVGKSANTPGAEMARKLAEAGHPTFSKS